MIVDKCVVGKKWLSLTWKNVQWIHLKTQGDIVNHKFWDMGVDFYFTVVTTRSTNHLTYDYFLEWPFLMFDRLLMGFGCDVIYNKKDNRIYLSKSTSKNLQSRRECSQGWFSVMMEFEDQELKQDIDSSSVKREPIHLQELHPRWIVSLNRHGGRVVINWYLVFWWRWAINFVFHCRDVTCKGRKIDKD